MKWLQQRAFRGLPLTEDIESREERHVGEGGIFEGIFYIIPVTPTVSYNWTAPKRV